MKKQDTAISLLLPILLACAAIVVAISFLPQPGAGGDGQEWEISLTLEGQRPFVSGEPSELRIISTCVPIDIFLDGEQIGPSGASSSMPLLLGEGNHSFLAKGDGCQASLSVEVLARECEGNQTSSCTDGGCIGVRRCSGGVYSGCSLPRKICVPGEKMGCSTDGCKFGYATCNACGNGFGECLPPANGSKNSGSGCALGSECN